MTSSQDFELPKIIQVQFLEDGIPVAVSQSGADAFELSDISSPNATPLNLVPRGTGIYEFEFFPDNNGSSQNLTISIDGSQIKTANSGESFDNGSLTFLYDPQTPVISSDSSSSWARGSFSSFLLKTSYASSVSIVGLPAGIDFNASSSILSGVPESGGQFDISITASNPAASTSQNSPSPYTGSICLFCKARAYSKFFFPGTGSIGLPWIDHAFGCQSIG